MAIEAASKTVMAYQGRTPAPEAPQVHIEIAEKSNTAAMAETEMGTSDAGTAALTGKEPQSLLVEEAAAKPSAESLRKAVDEINKNAKNSEVVFGVHDATNRVTIKIVDRDTKKVLKEYPPEKTLDMIAKVWEMAGLMVDEKG